MCREAADLSYGSNNATSAYTKTGLFPFNPLSDLSENAIDTLGIDNVLGVRRQTSAQWETRVLRGDENRPVLTSDERKLLCVGWSFQDEDGKVQLIDASQSDLLLAKM